MQQVFSPADQDTVIVGLEANPVAKTGNRIVSRNLFSGLNKPNAYPIGSSWGDRGRLS
jgi:hypothetical protein